MHKYGLVDKPKFGISRPGKSWLLSVRYPACSSGDRAAPSRCPDPARRSGHQCL